MHSIVPLRDLSMTEIEARFRLFGQEGFEQVLETDSTPAVPQQQDTTRDHSNVIIVRSNSSTPVRLADGSYA